MLSIRHLLKLLAKILIFLKKISIVMLVSFLGLAIVFLLSLSIRGDAKNQSEKEIVAAVKTNSSAFDLSQRGRYSLVLAMAENKNFVFNHAQALIALPDLARKDSQFVSLFPPGVSMLVLPFYLAGKTIGMQQIATFSVSVIFTVFNFILLTLITNHLQDNKFIGLLSGLTFVFATNAWVYSGSLYQHAITTFLILLSILILLTKKSAFKFYVLGFVSTLSVLFDYPNGLFFIPLIIWMFSKLIDVKLQKKLIKIKLSSLIFVLIFGFVIGVIPTFLYNWKAFGNPFQLAGTLERVTSANTVYGIEEFDPLKKTSVEKKVSGFFQYERLPKNSEVLVASFDRGLLVFSPVLFIGLIGLWTMREKNASFFFASWGLIFTIFGLYATWGDPWGGWGFGSRYLIPMNAILSIGVGLAISKYIHKLWMGISYSILVSYSVFVSLLGVLTTLHIPPSVEDSARNFPKLTYLHNFNLLLKHQSYSFIYNTYLIKFMPLEYLFFISFMLAVLAISGIYLLAVNKLNISSHD